MRAFVLCLAFLLAACNAVPVEHVPLAAPMLVPQDAHPAPIAFRALRYAVPLGTDTVGKSPHSLSCDLSFGRSQRRVPLSSVPDGEYSRAFTETLGGLGYDVAGDPSRMFDEEADQQRAVYAIGGRVTDIKIDSCNERGDALLFSYNAGAVGEAVVQIEWTVFDVLHQRIVYRRTTRGYAKLDAPSDEAGAILLRDTFAAAAHNLGADRSFYDLIVNGVQPPEAPGTYTDPQELPNINDRDPLILPRQGLRRRPAAQDIGALRGAAVLIQTETGFGSGFFITAGGLLLTDAHVVGHAKRVRVVTADKQARMIADVLRTDRKRDVALLRVENMPAEMKIPVLPLRRALPRVAEDVYAIGAPDLTRLQDTVTKGIVSAIRFDRREEQSYIQSDVFVYPGNSGGPLLDTNGNVIGLCEAGYRDGSQDLAGLNIFTPIGEALTALDIR